LHIFSIKTACRRDAENQDVKKSGELRKVVPFQTD